MKNTYSYHLCTSPYSQCHVEFVTENNANERDKLVLIRFYSYDTLEIEIVQGMDGYWYPVVRAYVAYSRTTGKQVNRFTTELYGESKYYQFKECEINHCRSDMVVSDDVIQRFYNDYRSGGKRFY